MKFLHRARPDVAPSRTARKACLALSVALGVLAPSLASAAEGDSVLLRFESKDTMMLWFAFAIGAVALIAALVMRSSLIAEAAGSERMQEVGKAIQDGALAYLRKQISTMSIFVILLAAGLVGLFWTMGAVGAFSVGLCFVLGVAGSYCSGYTGMLMAVASNMRVANAAITSRKKALEIAFRSGGVAGLFTIGIALMGATLILLFGGTHATTLLVGFGFGGSLAALFMRVGGGIFTKAADVGADLVGKVEAGIPEDDARNPATIADNVGDNVGDCAGMVADVFESYEVTLVAAIVLGAAAASVLDQASWTRLIVFALVVSALGLLASLIGINIVKGSDVEGTSTLAPINRGLTVAGLTAGAFSLIAAYVLMGGMGGAMQTTQLMPTNAVISKEVRDVLAVRDSLAADQKKAPADITAQDIINAPQAKDIGLDPQKQPDLQFVTIALQADPSILQDFKPMEGYSAVTDPKDSRIENMSIDIPQDPMHPMQAGSPTVQSVATALLGTKDDPFEVSKIRFTGDQTAQPPGTNAPPRAAQHVDIENYIGPGLRSVNKSRLDSVLAQQKSTIPNLTYTVESQIPVQLYVNGDGKPLLAVDTDMKNPFPFLKTVQQQQVNFMAQNADVINAGAKTGVVPPAKTPMAMAVSTHATIPWWCFFAPIALGILMSIVLQKMTDYYVSTHRKPTQEVAGVSNAGPAPMIIQGFAYGAESAVFMTVAIVFSLMFPLFFFPAARYGSYILSFYGIALVGVGLLTTTAFVLAMDTFGPISDNAQGVFEMSGEAERSPSGAYALQQLDAAGNTTKALTKGFAIATAVIAAAALFHSFVDSAQLNAIGLRLDVPEIFLGLLLGGAAPYLFSAFTINAVGRAAFELIHEVRRQFRNDPGIMEGTSKPDYAKCVALVTAAAQRELLGPGILAIALPVAVAFGFSIGKQPTYVNGHYYNLTGAEALGGFLAGAIVSGQLMAVLLANSGGMWDNAKKLIEDGMFGGKGSEAHKASVVCDTVGDPFKDTAGPALNPLIKVMNLVALLLAGIIVRPYSNLTLSIITGVAVLLLAASIIISQKGSMSQQMQAVSAEEHVVPTPSIGSVGGSAKPAPGKRRIVVEEDDTEGAKTS